jgi:hypothetical protein
MGQARDLEVATQHLPRFRALLARGKTPTSCLSLYYQHTVATTLLELSCLEEEEEEIDPPTLRVQAPLYRLGPCYIFSSGCPAADFSVAVAMARAPLSPAPLPGHMPLYKVILSPGSAYPEYMLPASLGSSRWRQL